MRPHRATDDAIPPFGEWMRLLAVTGAASVEAGEKGQRRRMRNRIDVAFFSLPPI